MLVNLVANARDAMPTGGSLQIRVDRHGTIDVKAMIEVTDSGSGMTPEVLARIFDPFYTTKAPGKGTGLGLALSRQYLESFGGKLDAENRPEGGACFTLMLTPAAEDELVRPAA
jgi:signal transduction histidine kinase